MSENERRVGEAAATIREGYAALAEALQPILAEDDICWRRLNNLLLRFETFLEELPAELPDQDVFAPTADELDRDARLALEAEARIDPLGDDDEADA